MDMYTQPRSEMRRAGLSGGWAGPGRAGLRNDILRKLAQSWRLQHARASALPPAAQVGCGGARELHDGPGLAQQPVGASRAAPCRAMRRVIRSCGQLGGCGATLPRPRGGVESSLWTHSSDPRFLSDLSYTRKVKVHALINRNTTTLE